MNPTQKTNWTALALLLASNLFAAAQFTNSPGPTDYGAFGRFISDRNIFDSARYPRTPGTPVRRTPSRPRSAPVPMFTFVGSMSYGKGTFAFFDGNNSEYRKALQTSGQIAGYTVKEISLDSVKLEAGGKQIEMKVGAQLRQESRDEWQLVGASAATPITADSSAPTASAASTTTSSVAPSSSVEANEVLKRLMKLREQENQ